ncbi:MAG: hypothetical protein A2Y17_07915 [Clostridiales bacterium GWF2_38_85]|nr:MAG: hypothetical protein A2Y17_07915 [Clostridiales bacterium GWF2_38_85]HBL84198.1 hypothetical protein [Clostridiales bacterium]
MRDNDIAHNCELCEFSTEVPGCDALICKKHGLIKRDSLCRKFRLDPLRLTPMVKKLRKNEFKPSDFLT